MSTTRTLPRVIRSIHEMKEWRKTIRSQKGTSSPSVNFVPTMGALHQGHAELLRSARTDDSHLVLSIFVNPTQFGPNEDFSRYPRTFEQDLEIAASCGVDVVFAPSAEELYPDGFSTFTEESVLSQPLCGKFRPGHFKGVTTIVLKLFNIVEPSSAYFGLKDAQQFYVLSKIVSDLNVSVKMHGIQTVRESDGLAMSSRNKYLTPDERKSAPLLYEVLTKTKNQIQETHLTEKEILAIVENAKAGLSHAGFEVQYLELLSLPNLAPFSHKSPHEVLLACACYLGKTRLIDNISFEI